MDKSQRIQLYERAPRSTKQFLLRFGLVRHKAAIRNQVYERERLRGNYPIKCLSCGEPAVDIHELNIRGYRYLAEQFKIYHVQNCFPLCRMCHDGLHGASKGVQVARMEFREKVKALYGYEYDGLGYWPEFYIDQARSISEWLEMYGVLELGIEKGWL